MSDFERIEEPLVNEGAGTSKDGPASVADCTGSAKVVRYVCKECPYVTKALADIEKHCIRKHGQKLLMFICSNCNLFRTFSTDNLVHHVKQHQVCSLLYMW